MTYYEIKKIFSMKRSKAALVILMGFVLLFLQFSIGATFYVNENGQEEYGPTAVAKLRELKKAWAGDLTEEKIRKVISENVRISQTPEALSSDVRQNNIAFSMKQGLMDIRNLLVYSYGSFNEYDYYLPDSLSPDQAGSFYSNRVEHLREWLNTEAENQFSHKEKAYLISRYEKLETPLFYDYQGGWRELFQYLPGLIMILTLVLGFLCAGIFSVEFQQKAGAVFFSSRYGRTRGTAAKIRAGLIVVTLFYWGFVLLYTGLVFGIFGADGADCPIQTSSGGWKSIYDLTNGQEYLLIVLGGYLGCLFVLLLTMWVSAKTNSSVIALLVPFVLVLLPSFLSGTSIQLLNEGLGLLPDQLLRLNEAVNQFNLYEIGGRVMPSAPILIVVYLILTGILVPVLYKTYRHKQVL